MKQLLRGLEHCHANHVLHRDIKSSNLLINGNGVLKIADFGLSTFFDPHNSVPLTTNVVTLWYRPPELLLGASHYGVGIDLWSTGCVIGEIYAGKPILPGKNEVNHYNQSCSYQREAKSQTFSLYSNVLDRPTAQDIRVVWIAFRRFMDKAKATAFDSTETNVSVWITYSRDIQRLSSSCDFDSRDFALNRSRLSRHCS